MGMPITVEVVDHVGAGRLVEAAFAYFQSIDERFSPFKPDSEVCRYNRGQIKFGDLSADFVEIWAIADLTFRDTDGFFDIRREDGSIDPSGVVKGWAIRNAARQLAAAGAENFLVDAGGDIQTSGHAADGTDWLLGIRNPFDETGVIKSLRPRGRGVATSGTYVRGQHIRNPRAAGASINDIVSLTVIGRDALEADRFATAAFAMGADGIYFLERMPGLEGYVVSSDGVATATSGFGAYVA